LPLTANGKLDRGALPEPAAAPERPAHPASDDLAGQVAAIFREVLRVDDIGPDQSLFRLGGHSLSITRIASRLRRQLDVDLPLVVFYDAPTVAGVVEAIRRAR
ncbi:MAG TPA: phosphopantetheine-binding protein, partial [Candidatus Dormibacteraeota bacterium]|nr:phosphopantetheine-binding protein [Candidatus Dormibacteraeota bacterium]